jgi:hypothetical protein
MQLGNYGKESCCFAKHEIQLGKLKFTVKMYVNKSTVKGKELLASQDSLLEPHFP